MSKQIRITGRRKAVVYDEGDTVPFWLRNIILIIVVGLVLLIGGMIVLSMTEWGRVTMVWTGLALGAALTVCMSMPAWRSLAKGEPAVAWCGEALAAIGWGGVLTLVTTSIPLTIWLGDDAFDEWHGGLIGAIVIGFTAIAALGMWMITRGPLPVLDRTPRAASVRVNSEDGEGTQRITVRYRGADGAEHDAPLADRIEDSWVDRFAPGSIWQVYTFVDPDLAAAVVFLTEEHDDVWRDGYSLDGVRLGGESGPLKPGPGSPFLAEGGRWTFADERGSES